ncbi:MAG: hypothetical protein ACO4AU_10075 [bacterium]|jgi:hypothetical protein
MLLLGLHVVAIGALVGITWTMAYSSGKKDGLEQARVEQELLLEEDPAPQK